MLSHWLNKQVKIQEKNKIVSKEFNFWTTENGKLYGIETK